MSRWDKIIIAVLAFAAQSSGYAAEDLHYTDIYHPMFNFILLFGLIGWKLKGSISNAFTRNAEEVENLYVVAEEKDKKAQVKLDMFAKKMESIEASRANIIDSAKADFLKFEQEYRAEVDANIERVKREAIKRVESEKNEMIRNLNESLFEQVISKTKTSIRSNDNYRQKATEKLLAEVR